MSWLRIGDTATIHPRVLELHDPADPLVGPAAWGFVMHMATLCAKDGTYDVAPGYIAQAGGPAAPQLLKRAAAVGLLVCTGGTGKSRRWKLIDDDGDLLHIRTRAEKEWEAQQRADNGNEQLTTPVLLRDGDACRYCRRVVQPMDNKSNRGRTFDHLRPGDGARTPDDLVVACRGCNGRRGQAWQDGDTLTELAERFPLLPPPSELLFVQSTVTALARRGYTIPADATVIAKADHASRAPRAGGDQARPATQASAVAGPRTTPTDDQHPGTQLGVAAPDRAHGRAHPRSQPGVAPPSLQDDTHSDTQPDVAAPQDQHDEQEHDRPNTDRSVTDRSGTAGPGRAGYGSGSGRVAGPPSRSSPHPTPPAAPPTSAADPARTTRRSRRRPRAAGTWT